MFDYLYEDRDLELVNSESECVDYSDYARDYAESSGDSALEYFSIGGTRL